MICEYADSNVCQLKVYCSYKNAVGSNLEMLIPISVTFSLMDEYNSTTNDTQSNLL